MASSLLLRKFLLRHIAFSEEELAEVESAFTCRKVARRAFIHTLGTFFDEIYFIEKGCLRYFHVIDGEEHTGQFFFEESFYTDYESFLMGMPSRVTVQAIEPTILYVIKKKQLQALYDTYPRFERFGRFMAEQAFVGLWRRSNELLNLEPKERYLHLLKTRPKVIERAPQQYIASYLAIQPQSLSRIRKRLAEEK